MPENVKRLYVFRIQSSKFDGSDVRVLGSARQRISHPFGLALYHGGPNELIIRLYFQYSSEILLSFGRWAH